jgi:gamma-glutamylcyclotransferase (GGCT)/AIG2-like uncharacterized protein YtfP
MTCFVHPLELTGVARELDDMAVGTLDRTREFCRDACRGAALTVTDKIFVFSYGTLQLESVQLASFGRRLVGHPDEMPGYKKTVVEITDPQVLATSGERFHPIVLPSDDPADNVGGTVFEITVAELAAADKYEVSDYRRVAVVLRSGIKAWVYVKA